MKQARIIDNSVAGQSRGEELADDLVARLAGDAWECQVDGTTGAGDAERFAAAVARDGADLVVAVGGGAVTAR